MSSKREEAARKGGEAVSEDREHMSEIGRKKESGGQQSGGRGSSGGGSSRGGQGGGGRGSQGRGGQGGR